MVLGVSNWRPTENRLTFHLPPTLSAPVIYFGPFSSSPNPILCDRCDGEGPIKVGPPIPAGPSAPPPPHTLSSAGCEVD